MKPSLELSSMWSALRAHYDTAFLEDLVKLPQCDVYIFGGTVRDMLLGKPWKDIDCRVVCPLPNDERNSLVESVLLRHGTPAITLFFSDDECKVHRMHMPGNKKIVVDFQITDTLQRTPGDFRACCNFYNMKTGEFVEQMPGCFDDFEKKLIYPADSMANLPVEPHLFIRSLKLACQTGFTHHPEFAQVMQEQKHLVGAHVDQVLGYIKEHGKDSYVEAMLGNFFNALKSDPKRYMALLQEFGFFEEWCTALVRHVGGNKGEFVHPDPTGESFNDSQTFEQRLSIFVSMLARAISTQPEKAFAAITHAYALDTDRTDGNEFVVNSKEVIYVN